jgi:hypothetical protein
VSSEAGSATAINRLLSSKNIIVGISSTGAAAVGTVQIGLFTDELGIPKQTQTVEILPQNLVLGQKNGVNTTNTLTIGANGDITISSATGDVNIDSAGGNVNIGAAATQVNVG